MAEASENTSVPEVIKAHAPAQEAKIPVAPRHRPTANPHERWDRYDGRVRRTDRIIGKAIKVTPEFEQILRDNCHRLNMTQIEVLEASLFAFHEKYKDTFVD